MKYQNNTYKERLGMAINLEKGNGICLDKVLSRVAFTVSWDTSEDVDISAM